MDVGVRDRGDVDAGVLGGPLERRQVTRRVDDQRPGPVVDQVAAVAELGHLDGDDLHESLRSKTYCSVTYCSKPCAPASGGLHADQRGVARGRRPSRPRPSSPRRVAPASRGLVLRQEQALDAAADPPVAVVAGQVRRPGRPLAGVRARHPDVAVLHERDVDGALVARRLAVARSQVGVVEVDVRAAERVDRVDRARRAGGTRPRSAGPRGGERRRRRPARAGPGRRPRP